MTAISIMTGRYERMFKFHHFICCGLVVQLVHVVVSRLFVPLTIRTSDYLYPIILNLTLILTLTLTLEGYEWFRVRIINGTNSPDTYVVVV